MVNNNQHNASD